MAGNTLTIELPDEIAVQLAAMSDEERNHFAVAALSTALEAAVWDESDDPQAIAEIGAALQRMEAAQARGERGMSVDEAWAELERRAAERRRLAAG